MTAQHSRDLETTRRYATLLAVLLEAKATLIDQALDLHDRMIGALFNRAKRRHAEEFQQSGEAIHEKVRSIGALVKLCSKPDKAGPILSPLLKRSSRGKRYRRRQGPTV